MGARVLADAVVGLHFAFVLFVVLGGFLVAYRRWLVCLHLPCAVWGFMVELLGYLCPLTHLENELRRRAGEAGYAGGFVEHYLLPVLYPAGLTRGDQWLLAALVIAVNSVAYGWVLWRWRQEQRRIE